MADQASDTPVLDLLTRMTADSMVSAGLDGQSLMIARIAALVAVGAPTASYLTNLGYAYQLLGRRPDAVAKYREAIRIDDKFASAWINLGTALAQDPKTRAEARSALTTAQKIDPTDPRVKANLEELDALEKQQH